MKPIQKRITFDAVRDIQKLKPKKICFEVHHQSALKRSDPPHIGIFSVPFSESIYPIFNKATKLDLFFRRFSPSENDSKYWRSIQDEDEYKRVEKFIENFRSQVFLRDMLALSVAIKHNVDYGTQSKTDIGELEKSAKYDNNSMAINELAQISYSVWQKLPFYNQTTTICAIPPSKLDETNLPNQILLKIQANYPIVNISNGVNWIENKISVKNLPFDKKWSALEQAGLHITADVRSKDIILFDDLYQSGTTMQYVAMKLQQAGAARIFGLSIVKSLNDTDNT